MKSKIKGPDGKGELFGRGAGEVDLGESGKEGNKLVVGKRYAFRLKKKADGGWELADKYVLGYRVRSVKERALCVAACEIKGLEDLRELLQSGLLRRRAVVLAKA